MTCDKSPGSGAVASPNVLGTFPGAGAAPS